MKLANDEGTIFLLNYFFGDGNFQVIMSQRICVLKIKVLKSNYCTQLTVSELEMTWWIIVFIQVGVKVKIIMLI